MKPTLRSLLAALAMSGALCSPSGTLAQTASTVQTKVLADVKMSVDLPKDWKAETDGPMTISTAAADDASVMVFALLSKDDVARIGGVLDQQLAQQAKNIKWDAEQKATRAGLPAITKTGTAEMDGKATTLMSILVVNGDKGVLIFAAYQTSRAAYRPILEAVLESVKPAR